MRVTSLYPSAWALVVLAALAGCTSPVTTPPESAPELREEIDQVQAGLPSEQSATSLADDLIESEEVSQKPLPQSQSSNVIGVDGKSEKTPAGQMDAHGQGNAVVNVDVGDEEKAMHLAYDEVNRAAVADLCQRIGNKLGSVSVDECHQQPLIHSAMSTGGLSLAYRDYLPKLDREPLGRVLVLGGIHGDEFSSVSVVFKWLNILDQTHSGLFHWRFAPLVNPDGLLQARSQRQNLNGVDLNRNFPTADWDQHALRYWREATYRNPRRYPGPYATSELETQWVVDQINQFQPDVIIAMHAPYHLVDYDGPPRAPANLGGLYLRQLGVFPGSLGNYVGVDMGKPIVTVELKSAGIMPARSEIQSMWSDLVDWLKNQLSKP